MADPSLGGHSGGRGKKSHKGQRRHFTDADELKQQAAEDQRKREMRRKQGLASDEEEETEEVPKQPKAEGDNSGSESESESESDEDASKKGVSHLIAIENPNRIRKSTKKVTALTEDDGAQGLSRREREEIEKQQAKIRYQQLHAQGKTEEAISDMARLALIRRQREETAKKREEEKKVKEAATKKGKS